MKSNRKDSA